VEAGSRGTTETSMRRLQEKYYMGRDVDRGRGVPTPSNQEVWGVL